MEEIKLTNTVNHENIPKNFFRKLVEVENLHQKNKLIGGFNDKKNIEELASLYKLAVEYYHDISTEKENYFHEKLNKLLSNEKVIKLMNENNKEIYIKGSFSLRKEKKFKNIFKTQFKITMNKIESSNKNIEKLLDLKIQNEENEEYYEKSVEIINNNIDEQEINFRLKLLEKSKKEKKGLSNLSDDIDQKNINISNLSRSPKKSYLNTSPRKFSLFSLEYSDNKKDKENYNSINNSNLLNFNKKNISINFFIDRFLIWIFHKFTQKFQNIISKSVKKLFEENFINKKDIYLEYEDEFASCVDIFDKKNNEYDESIQTIIESLSIDRNEKIQIENIKLLEQLSNIKQKGKMDKISEDKIYLEYIDDLKNNIMMFFINKK
jgi:hypothetical protein